MKRSFQALAGLLLCSLVLSGCGPSGNASNSHAPEKPKVESDLPVITLNAEAYKSLRIVSEPIHTEKIQEFLQLTGWIMAPQGKEVTITAPVAGYVRLSDKLKRSPIRGENVDSGKELFNLEPVLSPVEEIQLKILKQGVESELKKALSTYQNAEKELKRTKDLMKKGLSTQQELDQKQVRFDLAEEDLKAARKKQEFFQNPTRSILARQPGSVLQVHVSPGQYVAAAAPLVTIADLKQLWVRVPIPELDFPSVEAKKEVSVRLKGMNQTSGTDKNHRPAATFKAEPVAMVPQVDTVKHTVDVIYQLMPGPRGISFAKDQMVTVFVPLGKERVESVVPYSAVVFDAFGGSWIYLDRGADKGGHKFHFERRRVELGATVTIKGKDGKAMDRVVIRPSGRVGERVVTSGAALLFSREFHNTPAEIDDDD